MNIDGLIITQHARERFMARLKNANPEYNGDTDSHLKKLLLMAVPEKKYNLCKRLMREFKYGSNSRYWVTTDGWRFIEVNNNGQRKIVTIERICGYQNQVGD